MKKNFKLVLALVLAAMMLVGSFAMAEDGYDPKLKITGLAAGDTVTLYKVVEWVGSENTNAVSGWIATSDYATILTSDALKGILGVGQDATNITSTQAGELARASVGKTVVNTKVLTDGTYEYSLATNDGPGIYMALITPADPDTVYNPVFVSSDYMFDHNTSEWNVTEESSYASSDAAAKKATTELDKTADTSEDTWDDAADTMTAIAAGKLHWTTTAIGDTVNFTVATTIPGYGNIYQNPTFELTDKLSDMEMENKDDSSIKVFEGEADGTLLTKGADKDYTVTANAGGYTITFTSEYLKKHTVPHKVTVTYNAVVTTDAVLNVNPEKNEVSTKFSHTPSSEDDYAFKKDVTNHYTFTIDADALFKQPGQSGEYGSELVKVGVDANNKPITSEKTWSRVSPEKYVEGPLEGAVFGLFTDADCTVPYQIKGETYAAGKGYEVTTGDDGRMTFPGLDAGTYYLKEISAPTGYVANTQKIKIQIEADVITNTVTEWTNDGVTWVAASDATHTKSYTYDTEVLKSYTIKVDDQPIATHTFAHDSSSTNIVWTSAQSSEAPYSIQNVKGIELPSTGGVGTTIFYVGGSLMVLAAAILLITKRRMGVED